MSKAKSGRDCVLPRLQATRRTDRHSYGEAPQIHRAPVEAAASLARSGHFIKPVLLCPLASGIAPHPRTQPEAMRCRTGCTGASSSLTMESLSTGGALDRCYSPPWPIASKDTNRCGKKPASSTETSQLEISW